MLSTERRSADYLTARRLRSQNTVIGIDGGGTKTEAVIMDANHRVLGEGIAGPSNPLRVGIVKAAAAIREAIDKACQTAQVQRTDIQAAEVGLAGARREGLCGPGQRLPWSRSTRTRRPNYSSIGINSREHRRGLRSRHGRVLSKAIRS